MAIPASWGIDESWIVADNWSLQGAFLKDPDGMSDKRCVAVFTKLGKALEVFTPAMRTKILQENPDDEDDEETTAAASSQQPEPLPLTAPGTAADPFVTPTKRARKVEGAGTPPPPPGPPAGSGSVVAIAPRK